MTKQKWKQLFSNRIMQRLGDLDISQNELALRVGVDKSTISKYLSCERVPDAIMVVNLAKALKVNPSWLIDVDETVDTGYLTK
jgi:transcriptional regulator with XRE-family HTH domain